MIMDPDEVRFRLLVHAGEVIRQASVGRNPEVLPDTAVALARGVKALDRWLSTGGALPSAWGRLGPVSEPGTDG